MEPLQPIAEKLTGHLGELIDTSYRLSMATAAEKASNAASTGLSMSIGATLGLFVLFFAGAGLAIWIGEVMNDMKAGFFITAGIFAFFFIIFMAIRKSVLLPGIRNALVKKMYE